jgi:ABC-type branched-subunit amino acid transport system substrate-binding protein
VTRALVLATVLVLCAPQAVRAQSAVPPTIKVGGIADAELFGGAEAGARARFDAVNAAGGIDGRRIEFLGVADDRRGAAAATAEVRRLVDDVGVDAVVPVVTSRFADDGTLARARIPAFGWGIAGGFCGNRWAFAITGCLAPLLPREVPTIWGELAAAVAREHGFRHPTAAIVTEAAAVPRSLVELRAMARAAGLRVTYARAALGTGESATTGVDAIADAVMAAGDDPPSVVFSVAGFTAVGALQDALRARSFPGVMTNLVQYSPVLVIAARDTYVLTQFATPESAPRNAAMRKILAELATVTTDPVTPSMLAGWLAADLYVRARRSAGPGASPSRVARVAARMRFRVPATVGPTRFPEAFVRPTSCGQLVTSDATAYSIAARYRCAGYAGVG